jgi:hypothetical protein
MITRNQYMANSEALHDAYYGQFVNSNLVSRVVKAFGIERFKQEFSKDKHLNGIGLHQWDRLAGNYKTPSGGYASNLCASELKAAGDGPTWSTAVCILKAAARIAIQ